MMKNNYNPLHALYAQKEYDDIEYVTSAFLFTYLRNEIDKEKGVLVGRPAEDFEISLSHVYELLKMLRSDKSYTIPAAVFVGSLGYISIHWFFPKTGENLYVEVYSERISVMIWEKLSHSEIPKMELDKRFEPKDSVFALTTVADLIEKNFSRKL